MSSINFNITYERQPVKKVTISKASTINQLVSQSLTVFKINPSLFSGKLYHNDKLLDGTLPIRLTNLLNNSKLILKLTKKKIESGIINQEINVKFMNDQGENLVKKISNNLKLNDVIKEFGGDLTRPSILRILELNIDSEKYDSITLESIVGDSKNVIIRLNYKKNFDGQSKEEIERKQQEAIKLHIEQEKLRKQKDNEARLTAELEKKKQQQQQQEEEFKIHDDVKSEKDIEMKEPEDDIEQVDNNEPEPEPEPEPEQPQQVEQIDESNHYTFKEEELKDTPELYIPSETPQKSYNNPDEDYEVTLHQVKAYQNMIRNAGQRKPFKNKVSMTLPKKYQIRLKFPDGTILQINFIEDVEQIKFGQLIKKIDELLLPDFINEYNLKNSVPPFTTLDMNFNINNEYLHKLPDFQQERIMLIWELQKKNLNIHGPYVKNNQLTIKKIDELPERILETHRGELPDDESHKKKLSQKNSNKSTANDDNDDNQKDSKKSKVPKWFKMK